MSGLLRKMYPNFYNDITKKYDDESYKFCIFEKFNDFEKLPKSSLKVNKIENPQMVEVGPLYILENTYPIELLVGDNLYGEYPELVEKSKNESITLDMYVKYVKRFLHAQQGAQNYDNVKKKINPFEFSIRNIPIKFICRASYKLANIDYIFKIMEDHNSFADLCGGPGGFSEYLLNQYPNTSGLGMTLKNSENSSFDWKIHYFRKNIDRKRFQITYGADIIKGPDNNIIEEGDGNIFKIENIDSFTNQITKTNKDGIHLVVSDGAYFADEDEEDDEMDSKELSQLRIFIGELFLASQILKKGGNFVMKIFKTKYLATQSLIVLLASMFEDSYIFKPITSRINSSERYFVGKGFRYSPSDKIYYDFFKDCLTKTDLTNFSFIEEKYMTQDIRKYFYETSLENLQRQNVFCFIFTKGFNYNWKNYVSMKKLWTVFFNN